MTLTTLQIADLASSFGAQAIARVSDPTARALAIATTQAVKAERVADAERAAETRMGYSAEETARQETLMRHVWPRASRIRSAIVSADGDAREAHQKHDAVRLYDAVLRAHRLSVLAERVNAQARRVGAFSLSFTDMHAGTSRFLVKARWRRFMFAGGRDRVSSAFTDEDVLQGAFLRAIDAGDAMFGVPMWGALFRHVQAERAHLTRVAGAEWRGIQDALHGVRPTESAYPATDDKHAIRRLGKRDAFGRPFGTLDTHRSALAIAHREAERENVADAVTQEARDIAILAGDARGFGRILASVLMSGATLGEVSDALGLTVPTLRERVIRERDSAMASGVDHSEDVPEHVAERERDVLHAQSVHAETLRERYVSAATDDGCRGYLARKARTAHVHGFALGVRVSPRDADAIRRRMRRLDMMQAIASAGQRAARDGYRPMPSTGDMERDAYARVRYEAERASVPFGMARVNRAIASGIIRAGLDARIAETFANEADYLSRRAA